MNKEASKYRRLYKNKKEPQINLAPFVDILFILLTAFIVATPIMLGGVNVELPKGKAEIIFVKQDPIVVSVKNDGTIYIDQDLVKLSLLGRRLAEVANNNMELKIYVKADVTLNYGRVIKVVGAINSAGFNNLSLVTDMSRELGND